VTVDRVSDATEPGKVVEVGTASTVVLSATEPDPGIKVIFVNNSDTDITVRPAASGATPGAGVVLKAHGGAWDEDRAATAFCACHHGGSGTKSLSVVIL
jgi:hypothetical protein